LNFCVWQERYDDAAKIRDQIGVAIGSDKTASLLYDLEQVKTLPRSFLTSYPRAKFSLWLNMTML
jgi:hypothetical protein